MDTSEIQNSLKYKLGDKIDYLGVFTSDHIINIQINKHRNKVIGFICNTFFSKISFFHNFLILFTSFVNYMRSVDVLFQNRNDPRLYTVLLSCLFVKL